LEYEKIIIHIITNRAICGVDDEEEGNILTFMENKENQRWKEYYDDVMDIKKKLEEKEREEKREKKKLKQQQQDQQEQQQQDQSLDMGEIEPNRELEDLEKKYKEDMKKMEEKLKQEMEKLKRTSEEDKNEKKNLRLFIQQQVAKDESNASACNKILNIKDDERDEFEQIKSETKKSDG